jgi:hypothetical protein
MQRAAEQGYTDRLRHSSSEVFAGSPQAEEALGFGIPIQNEFKNQIKYIDTSFGRLGRTYGVKFMNIDKS